MRKSVECPGCKRPVAAGPLIAPPGMVVVTTGEPSDYIYIEQHLVTIMTADLFTFDYEAECPWSHRAIRPIKKSGT